MTTNLSPIDKGVNLLLMDGVAAKDIVEVDAWLFAMDMRIHERNACRDILFDCGEYSFSNIEHRVTVVCRSDTKR